MNRLRRLSRDYLLPMLIGALVLRALIPVGFMPGMGGVLSLTATLCNAQATGSPGIETLEIPDAGLPRGAGAGGMHCDFCLVPVMAGLHAQPAIEPPSAIRFEPVAAGRDAPSSRFALARAQIPRAPPLI